MGVQASTNSSSNYVNLTSEAFNSCPTVTASNVLNIDDVNFKPSKLCYAPGQPQPTATFDQSAGVNASCVISAMQNALASYLSKQAASVAGGLGIQWSSDVNQMSTNITTHIMNTCGSQSSTNAASIGDTQITACQWHFVENATVQESCYINELQTLSNKASITQDSKTKGASIFGSIFGSTTTLIVIIVVVVVVIIIIIIVVVVVNKKKS